jgi:hypothetical protein
MISNDPRERRKIMIIGSFLFVVAVASFALIVRHIDAITK